MEAVARAMANAFRDALGQVRPREEKIPVPTFSGEGDVELFIQQFQELSVVLRWTAATSVLKLRHALQGKAQPCGQGYCVADIFANLRLRFGMSSNEARSCLATIRRSNNVSLAEHASKIKQLVRVGYATVDPLTQAQLVADSFRRSAGHDGLHRHLLAIASDNVDDLVRAGNAYLQTFSSRGDRAYAVESSSASAVQTDDKSDVKELKEVVLSLRKEIAQLQKEVQSAKHRPNPPVAKPRNTLGQKQPPKCFECGRVGHIRRNCPDLKRQLN